MVINNKYPIYLLILLITCSFSLGASPFIQTSTSVDGLEIEYPPSLVFKTDETINMYFHIFNLSDGYMYRDGDNINCTLHLYDDTHAHIYKNWTNIFDDVFDFEFTIPGYILSPSGTYAGIIQCETVDERGGFAAFTMEVTDSGRMDNVGSNLLPAIAVQLFLIMFFIFLGKITFNDQMDSKGFWLGFTCWFFVFIETISTLAILHVYYNNGDISIITSSNFYAIMLVSFLWFMFILVDLFMKIFDGTSENDKWGNDIGPGKKW